MKKDRDIDNETEGSSAAGARERILSEATRLFARFGFDGTSVRDIVGAAGVNVSLVSYHFGGKDALFDACIKTFAEANQQFVRMRLVPPKTAEAFRSTLASFIDGFLLRLLDDAQGQQLALRALDFDPSLFQQAHGATFRATFQLFVDFFAGAESDGLLAPGVDPLELASSLHGLLNHQARVEPLRRDWFGKSLKDAAHRDHVTTQLVGMLLNGALPR